MNILIFLAHSIIVSLGALCALRLGKSALVTYMSGLWIFANLFVLKQITLGGFHATAADAFTIGAVFSLNMLQEYYGKKAARSAIWTSFCMLIFYALISHVHLSYTPSSFDTMQPHYQALLGFMPRIALASLTSYLLIQLFDSWLFGALRKILAGNYLALRTAVSLAISQLFDTILFSFLGLYGLVDNLWQIIIISYTIKLAAIALSTPCAQLSKKVKR